MLTKKINIYRFSLISFLLFVAGINVSCGGQRSKEIPTKTSLTPVIRSVIISPERPNKESELSLVIQSHSPSKIPLTYRYQWIRNNEEISGEDGESLKSGKFKKGDLVRVKVIPYDGELVGATFWSDPVKISNMPPMIGEIIVEPRVAYANSALKAVVSVSDPDGDPVSLVYRWEKDGAVLSENDTGILEPNKLKKGDSVTVTVTPNDGEASGKPEKSEAVIIANKPPIIVSTPTSKLEGNIYTYQVKAEDPDNDPITFALKTAPRGMGINPETGLIRWEVSRQEKGNHLIEIEASDPEGAKSFQKYRLAIEFR